MAVTKVEHNGQGDGLASRVEAVAEARERLGRDLDQLTTEVQAQVGVTVQRVAWKAAVAVSAVAASLVTRKLLTAAWRRTQHRDPPDNPASPDTTWGEALTWTVATAVGMGVARLVAQRGAAAGWQRATGNRPPGLEA